MVLRSGTREPGQAQLMLLGFLIDTSSFISRTVQQVVLNRSCTFVISTNNVVLDY